MEKSKLPVGIDGFEKIRRNGFYYIDKTKLIEQLFSSWGEVNLFTRPRRFGKTLNSLYFTPYNNKVWRQDISQIAMDWLEDKLPMPGVNIS